MLWTSVVDPHWFHGFNADPDPEQTFYVNADQDPGSPTNADRDLSQTLKSKKLNFYLKIML